MVLRYDFQDVGHKGRIHLPHSDLLPVGSLEKLMLLDLTNFEPCHWVICKKLFHQVPSISPQIFGQIKFPGPTLLHYSPRICRLIFILKWCEPANHLTYEYANTPDITLVRMAHLRYHYLWCTVPWSATIGKRPIFCNIVHYFCKSKIY